MTPDARRLYLDPAAPDRAALDTVARVLETDGVVIMPTDTVYGLVCRCDRPGAIERMYAFKSRPRSDPLILLVHAARQLAAYAADVPAIADMLATRFWPGALTLVLRRGPAVPDLVTGGGATVGFRMPDHEALLAVLRCCGVPLASTSANRHGGASPQDADAAITALGAPVDLVVDSGPTVHGQPSTVLDCTVHPPAVVRAGALDVTQVRAALRDATADITPDR